MDDPQRKAQLKKTFDTVAEGYGSSGMEFFYNAAVHLPGIFRLQGHEQLFDVATGSAHRSANICCLVLASHCEVNWMIICGIWQGIWR